MGRYLAESVIRHAVGQLRKSSASRVCEFLIGVRTLTLAETQSVAIAESIPEYMQAVREFTQWTDDESARSPYFNPFGSQADFKSKKYPSNGPSNTMHGWATQPDTPFEVDGSTRPKRIQRIDRSVSQLRAFCLKGKEKGANNRPRLIDAAVWFYRATDFEGEDINELDREGLEKRFVSDVGLNSIDVEALFRMEEDDSPDDIPAASPGEISDVSSLQESQADLFSDAME